MGKKFKMIPFLFRSLTVDSWPSCSTQPKTLSFRSAVDVVVKTVNSPVISLAAETENSGDEEEEEAAVLSGLRARGRLFFEPEETSSILNLPPPAVSAAEEVVVVEVEQSMDDALFKGSLVTAMDSMEPVMDFMKSMEEMVEAHGLKDWAGLEELLALYLHVNERCNHGYIVGAFADLLIKICFSSPSMMMTTSSVDHNGDDDDLHLLHHHHHHHHHHMSSSTSTSMSRSPTSALSFSSSTSSSSIVQSSLALLDEPDDHDVTTSISDSTTSVI